MGSRPSAPVTYRPTPTAPTIYQSLIPDKDYELARDYVDELKGERAKKKENLEDQGFGAADMAARQKSYLAAEQASYQASLPKNPLGGGSTTP
jgi:hypothetical protein